MFSNANLQDAKCMFRNYDFTFSDIHIANNNY